MKGPPRSLRRRIGLLVVLLLATLHCANTDSQPVPLPPSGDRPASPSGDRPVESIPLDDCPYRGLSVFSDMPEDWSEKDRDITARVGESFAGEMAKRGFKIVDPNAPDTEFIYWMAYNHAMQDVNSKGSFIWTAHTQALNDLRGRYHLGFAVQGQPLGHGVVAYYGLFQWKIDDLDTVAAKMAEQTARSLSPHMAEMCDDWITERRAEEARLEQIRQQLVEEIQRVRLERARAQHRELEVRIEGAERNPGK
ncbi:MAG TPA: hypothetical protein VIY27_05625 [Myxococcota bacterium]